MPIVMSPDENPRCTGLWSVATVASLFGVRIDFNELCSKLDLTYGQCSNEDLVRGITFLGLRARLLAGQGAQCLQSIRQPVILRMGDGESVILSEYKDGECALLRAGGFPHSRPLDALMKDWTGEIILIAPGKEVETVKNTTGDFGLQWYLSALWKYGGVLVHVLIASLFVQAFAL